MVVTQALTQAFSRQVCHSTPLANLSCWAQPLGAPLFATSTQCNGRDTAHALSQLPDSQTALLLLRHCASWSKLVYSSRVTPPPFHVDALKTYDSSVLQCLECCCTGALSRGACLQATLSTKCGGLGLRSVSRHSGAAYAASVLATTSVCCSLFPAYNSNLDTVLSNLNESLLASDHVPSPPPPTLRQQDLSRAVDRFTAAELASVCSGPGHEAFRAHFQLLQEPPPACATWKRLAHAVAGRTGESASVLTERLQQTLALTLQRENARAVLRRAGAGLADACSFPSP